MRPASFGDLASHLYFRLLHPSSTSPASYSCTCTALALLIKDIYIPPRNCRRTSRDEPDMYSLDNPTVHATRRDVHDQTTHPLPADAFWQDVSSIKRPLIFICSLFLISFVTLVLGYQSYSIVCFATATASCIITLSSMIARDASPYATFGWYIIWVLLYFS